MKASLLNRFILNERPSVAPSAGAFSCLPRVERLDRIDSRIESTGRISRVGTEPVPTCRAINGETAGIATAFPDVTHEGCVRGANPICMAASCRFGMRRPALSWRRVKTRNGFK